MSSIINHLSIYIEENLYDLKYGGFFTSINGSKKDIVTEDKTLVDMALGILAFSKTNNKTMIYKLLSDLDNFVDIENTGYFEILDSTNIVQAIGQVKTICYQVLVEYSKYVASIVLNDEMMEKEAKKKIEFIIGVYLSNQNASIYTVDWKQIIDEKKKLRDAALLTYICYQVKSYQYMDLLIFQLKKFVDGNRGAFSELDVNNQPYYLSSKTLSDMSLLILAIETVKLEDKELECVAEQTIIFIDKFYRHPLTKGFWDKSDRYGVVSVNLLSAYYTKSESPFPIKSMISHSLFLIALNSVRNSSIQDFIKKIKQETKKQIFHYYDEKNGGLNLGQGNWFSTPTTPTVPLARHVMVPSYTKGAFYVGNTAYLPLHEKMTSLQCLAILSLEMGDEKEEIKIPTQKYKKSSFVRKMDYIVSEPLTDNYIDLEKYYNWSQKTISGYSYGLTAYRSPLGVKSDKTPQNFSALHVVADMTLLNKPIPNKDELEITMLSSQNCDGGFAEQPSILSELFTTYCVVATEFIIGKKKYDREKCIEFVQSCQNRDGGFGNAPGYPSDSWHTNFGAVTLHLLNAEPLDRETLIQYLLHCQNDDGGFGAIPDGISETFSTFRVIDSLTILGVEIPNKRKAIDWLKNLQSEDGGFLYQKDKVVSFVGSYHAIGALYLLGESPNNVDQAKKWLSKHQSKDGGFSRAENASSDTTDEGFISIHASYMLEKKVNPYWIAIIT
ncbi:geranylgeranyl transferase type II beta subunit [Lactococcus piscium]|uniref:prenyltransferase/squalene oxidase repeat-containing protein n=1 Tax=Pseudolactococcus carnosus TaxID=2749961 RepID=UPI001FBBEBB0|nr:prenyltransferase/squalene oxidase repeat-containing protein [Lactococcus carnosus]MCJ1995239.1 geranylgeranyl transferase type II beta subunit [Lactococcus carnosus]